ncbi:hypothetical protein ACFL27_06680 [candidate division CSSED10-310 bacterium]|uniref:Uncharacterized protein n=1 Tax=candidate division CSSED10-310 bacterium TaxID=2855610 RepID=A0ABV6YUL6_UNCC1
MKRMVNATLFICISLVLISFVFSCGDDDDSMANPTMTPTVTPTVTNTPQEATTFFKTFGGENYDYGFCSEQTSDGGYIVVGETYSYGAGSLDIYLIKADEFGNEIWSRTYGGDRADHGSQVHQTNDGGYIISGYTGNFGVPDVNIVLLKTDSMGNEQWKSFFGGSDFTVDYSLLITSDNGYIIAGARANKPYLVKTDQTGLLEWEKIYADYRRCYSIQQLPSGGYILAGGSHYYTACLYEVDRAGEIVWSHDYSDLGQIYSVVRQNDGSLVATGSSTDNWSYLIKTDSTGIFEWKTIFNEEGCGYQRSEGLVSDSFGGFVVITTCWYSADSYPRTVIMTRFNAAGEIDWSTDTELIAGKSIVTTADDGYLTCGWANENDDLPDGDIGLFKTDFYGQVAN